MSEADSHEEGTRRDFLYIATGAGAAVVGGAAIWPVIDQMNPAKDVLALASIEVDVADVSPGSQITVTWRGKPIFIRHRTEEEIQQAKEVSVSELKDTSARNPNLQGDGEATDENRTIGGNEAFLVQIGICTHLGCVPIGDGAGDFGGWFCPCHGSHYDTSGRIRKGPAVENMHIPPAEWLEETVVKLG